MKVRFWILILIYLIAFAVFPIVPLLVLDSLGLADGLNEGNSVIATLPWLLFYTIPLGILGLIVWLILTLIWLISHLIKKPEPQTVMARKRRRRRKK